MSLFDRCRGLRNGTEKDIRFLTPNTLSEPTTPSMPSEEFIKDNIPPKYVGWSELANSNI